MSCTNPNCNEGCGCSNCCPPVPPPTPPTPPICEGTDCVEIYDGACVNYTGPEIDCLNIQPDVNLNTIIQIIASAICTTCGKTECINPFKTFFERFKFAYDVLYTNDENTTVNATFNTFLSTGLTFKKCKHCCPDSAFYVMYLNELTCGDVTKFKEDVLITPNYISITCSNCWTNYNTCATTFLTIFDPSFGGELSIPIATDTMCEYGGFNNVSGLCGITEILQELFTYSEITEIMAVVYSKGLWLVCDLPSGNIVIGSSETVQNYITNNMQNF